MRYSADHYGPRRIVAAQSAPRDARRADPWDMSAWTSSTYDLPPVAADSWRGDDSWREEVWDRAPSRPHAAQTDQFQASRAMRVAAVSAREADEAAADEGLSLSEIYDRHAELHDLLWEATEDLRRAAEARRRALAMAPSKGPLSAAIAAAEAATRSADRAGAAAEPLRASPSPARGMNGEDIDGDEMDDEDGAASTPGL